MNLFDLPRTNENAIIFLQEKGILPKQRICNNEHDMKLSIVKEVQWQYSKMECKPTKIRMRVGNFFKDTRLPFVMYVRFFYM